MINSIVANYHGECTTIKIFQPKSLAWHTSVYDHATNKEV